MDQGPLVILDLRLRGNGLRGSAEVRHSAPATISPAGGPYIQFRV